MITKTKNHFFRTVDQSLIPPLGNFNIRFLILAILTPQAIARPSTDTKSLIGLIEVKLDLILYCIRFLLDSPLVADICCSQWQSLVLCHPI